MTTTAWAHLPNAEQIDRVLAHLKAHPERWNAARGVVRDAAWNAAWGAILALIAYDDCAHYLNLTPGAVRVAVSAGVPAAILLLPAVIAMEKTT